MAKIYKKNKTIYINSLLTDGTAPLNIAAELFITQNIKAVPLVSEGLK